ncbi:MAG: divalent-cation tolerance protein CutA [Desulfovibrio sp.]|nr:MAG: divalent-cation tolerance protein CutA [Desulfovibrio sp.]
MANLNVQALMVYVTASNVEEARMVGEHLVNQRLVACVNVIESIQSLFWWQGAVQSENESAFIAKTVPDKMDEVIAAVREKHSYDVPCIVALPIMAGDPEFLQWIFEETMA